MAFFPPTTITKRWATPAATRASGNPSHSHIVTVPTSPVNVIPLLTTATIAFTTHAVTRENVHSPRTTSTFLAVCLFIRLVASVLFTWMQTPRKEGANLRRVLSDGGLM